MAIAHFYNQYWVSLHSKQVNLTSDVINMVLLNSSYVPDKGNHRYYSDLTNELPTGGGYTQGGKTISSLGINVTNTNDVQTLTIYGSPTGGTFTLTFIDNTGFSGTTSALPYNPTAAQIQTALLALPNIGSNNVAVAGTDLTGPFTITFQQSLGATALPVLGYTDSLIGGTNVSIGIEHTIPGSGTIALSGASAIWTGATFPSPNAARYGVLVDTTPGQPSADPLIGFVDFCADQSPSNGTLSVTWAANGIGTVTSL